MSGTDRGVKFQNRHIAIGQILIVLVMSVAGAAAAFSAASSQQEQQQLSLPLPSGNTDVSSLHCIWSLSASQL